MKKIKITLDTYEHRAIVNIVNNYRNEQIKKGEPVDFINEILEKLLK